MRERERGRVDRRTEEGRGYKGRETAQERGGKGREFASLKTTWDPETLSPQKDPECDQLRGKSSGFPKKLL